MIFPFVLLGLDGLYLYLTQKYTTRVLKIKKMNYFAMIICYLFVLFAYYYFVYLPKKSAIYAFILGFTINGIYETTNLTIFENWPVPLVIMDTMWGGILFYLVTKLS
uniref:DUF2177 family protein n=1 Tax=viral metagenome TaxID=1070528 RepID=A0A6C0HSF3_9ZZZZ